MCRMQGCSRGRGGADGAWTSPNPLRRPRGKQLAHPSSALVLHSPSSTPGGSGTHQSSPSAAVQDRENRQGGAAISPPQPPKSWHSLKAQQGKHRAEGQILMPLRARPFQPRETWAEDVSVTGAVPRASRPQGHARGGQGTAAWFPFAGKGESPSLLPPFRGCTPRRAH